MVTIQVNPKKALADVPLKITVKGLKYGQYVTLSSKIVSEYEIPYYCIAHYVASGNGEVDLQRDASVGGFYKGIEPMGLIWAMRISPEIEKKFSRLERRDVTAPFVVEISVFDTHIGCVQDINESKALASTKIERWYMSEKVLRFPIQNQDVEGTLFIPKNGGPFPGIIDLFGSKNGITEFRASLLACYGYATLALKYFDAKVTMSEGLDMEYFERAAIFLSNHESVATCSIGVIGVSLGGTIALFMASYFSDLIKCAVNINGPTWVNHLEFRCKGRTWKPKMWDNRKIAIINNGYYIRESLEHLRPDKANSSLIEFHHCKADILFLTSGKDGSVRWQEHKFFVDELMQKGGKTNYEFVDNPGAGHLIEPPFSPFFYQTYLAADISQVWGGNAKDHARGQERSWEVLRKFLQRTLCQDAKQPREAKL